MQDEIKALQLCQSKVRAKKLPMEVVDAEYQWCGISSYGYVPRRSQNIAGTDAS